MRLTRKTASGKIVINEAAFPKYAPETIWNETSYFDPIIAVVEKIKKYLISQSECKLYILD